MDVDRYQLAKGAIIILFLAVLYVVYRVVLKTVGIENIIYYTAILVVTGVTLILSGGVWGLLLDKKFSRTKGIARWSNRVMENDHIRVVGRVFRKSWDLLGFITVTPIVIIAMVERVIGTSVNDMSGREIFGVVLIGVVACYLLLIFSAPLIPDRDPLSEILFEGAYQKVVTAIGHAYTHYFATLLAAFMFFSVSLAIQSTDTAGELVRAYMGGYIITLMWVGAPPLMRGLDR